MKITINREDLVESAQENLAELKMISGRSYEEIVTLALEELYKSYKTLFKGEVR